MTKYVLNPKNGRVFPYGPNLAKVKGLVGISDEDAKAIMGGVKSAANVVGQSLDAEAEIARQKAIERAKQKAKKTEQKPPAAAPQAAEAAAPAASDGEQKPPAVSVTVPGAVVDQLKEQADAEKQAEVIAGAKADELWPDVNKNNVTMDHLNAAADDQLTLFANSVLKVNVPTDRPPAEIRQWLTTMVGRIVTKREKAGVK